MYTKLGNLHDAVSINKEKNIHRFFTLVMTNFELIQTLLALNEFPTKNKNY